MPSAIPLCRHDGDAAQPLQQARPRATPARARGDYLAACKKLGQAPNKPASGRVMLRLAPELHARAAARAQVEGVSFNQWAAQVLERAAHEP